MYLFVIYMELEKNQILLLCCIKDQFQPLIKNITSVLITADSIHLTLNICFHHLLELSLAK